MVTSLTRNNKAYTLLDMKCILDYCDDVRRGGVYCRTHYMRAYRGQPLDRVTRKTKRPAIIEGDTAKIPLGILAKDGYSIIDKEFAHLDKYKWSLSIRGYVTKDRGDYLHHMIIGKPQKGKAVDHINRDRLDNRKENLRIVDYFQNAQNISIQKNNTSGYRGVWKKGNRWQADIKVNYKKLSLGSYATKEEAALAYNKAATEHFGEYAVLNIIKELYGNQS